MRRALQVFRGRGATIRRAGRRTIVEAKEPEAREWRHPWWVEMVFEAAATGTEASGSGSGKESGKESGSEWHAFVDAGFVNGMEAYISMGTGPKDDVGLTDLPAPYLVLRDWRNPLPEGAAAYPSFFQSLKVRTSAATVDLTDLTDPVLPAGDSTAPLPGTRELRAMDIVLAKARVATHLDIQIVDPFGDARLVQVTPTYTTQEVGRTGGRARLRATSQFTGEIDTSLAVGLDLALRSGDPGIDETLVATVWMVSPPDVSPDAEVDETWEPYVQPALWWNLAHAMRNVHDEVLKPSPLVVHTGLAAGIGDRINDLYLTTINDPQGEVAAYFNQAETRGRFWGV